MTIAVDHRERHRSRRLQRPADEHRGRGCGGNLFTHGRQDGAWIGRVDISISKAWTSRAFDISTKDLGVNAQPEQQFFGIHTTNGGKVAIFAGGIPLSRDGAVVGAIGVSGGAGEQDHAVAEAGAAAL